MINTATVQFSTLASAFEYAAAAHADAIKAVQAAEAVLQAARSAAEGTAVVKATLTKLFEERS